MTPKDINIAGYTDAHGDGNIDIGILRDIVIHTDIVWDICTAIDTDSYSLDEDIVGFTDTVQRLSAI